MQIKLYDEDIEKFIKSLEKQTIAKVLRTFDLLEQFGEDLKMPHSKSIGKGLHELRIRGVQEVRFIYTFQSGKIAIILHGFMKKSQKIPAKHLKLAQERKASLDSI